MPRALAHPIRRSVPARGRGGVAAPRRQLGDGPQRRRQDLLVVDVADGGQGVAQHGFRPCHLAPRQQRLPQKDLGPHRADTVTEGAPHRQRRLEARDRQLVLTLCHRQLTEVAGQLGDADRIVDLLEDRQRLAQVGFGLLRVGRAWRTSSRGN